MAELLEEITRNLTGYVLLIAALMMYASTGHETVAASLLAAALLGLQSKQAPPGDTKTLQITTPAGEKDKPST